MCFELEVVFLVILKVGPLQPSRRLGEEELVNTQGEQRVGGLSGARGRGW